jgi:chromosome segregation ATPase
MSDKNSDNVNQTQIGETGEKKSENKKRPVDHPIWIIATVVGATVLFCVTVGTYLHNLVIEQKNATIERLEKLREERKELNATLDNLREKLTKIAAERTNLRNEKEALTTEVENLRKKMKETATENTKLRKGKEELTTEVENLRKKMKETTTENSKLRNEKEALTIEVENLRENQKKTTAKIAKFESLKESRETHLSSFTNEEIKAKALERVRKLRDFSREWDQKREKSIENTGGTAKDEETLKKELKSIDKSYWSRYVYEFKSKNTVLRKELQRRLKDESRIPSDYEAYSSTYSRFHYFSVSRIADDLEKLSLKLPVAE